MAIEGKTAPAPHHLPEISRRRFVELLLGTGATVLGVEEGLSRLQQQEGWVTKAIKAGQTWFEERLRANQETTVVFNPNAQSGEINTSNNTVLSVTDLPAQAKFQIIEENKAITPLPFDPGEAKINFNHSATPNVIDGKTNTVKDLLELTGIPKGTTVLAPFDGLYTFSQTRNNTGTYTIASINFLVTPDRFRNFIFQTGESASSLPGASEETKEGVYGSVTKIKLTTEVKAGTPLFIVNTGSLKLNISSGVGDAKTGGAVFEDGKPIPPQHYELGISTAGEKYISIKND